MKGIRPTSPLVLLVALMSLATLSSGQETPQKKEKPTQHAGLEIRAKSKGDLKVEGSVEVTITLENHNKVPIQTLVPPPSKLNLVWNLTFEPAIHEEMAGPSTFPKMTYQKVVTIQPKESTSFSFTLKRTPKGVFVKSKGGEFGCLHEPAPLPKDTKELKLFYNHTDSDTEWLTPDYDGPIKFTEKRWVGRLRSKPVVIKTP